jgi:uncharacterized protein (DUF302 family)
MTQTHSYSIGITLDLPFHEAVSQIKEAFKAEGFGALSEIDVQCALKEKIGETIEPYLILGMCNPHLAARAIAAEPAIGALLPCNVLVHQHGGQVYVDAQDPAMFAQVVDNPKVEPIASEARAKIENALRSLHGE